MENVDGKYTKHNSPVFLYMHAGSGNHGCEAIADSVCLMMADNDRDNNYCNPIIVSHNVIEDNLYSLGNRQAENLCSFIQEKDISNNVMIHTIYYLYRKLTGDRESFQRYRFSRLLERLSQITKSEKNNSSITAVSIGGDNYCYPEMVDDMILADRVFIKKGYRTILMGCSIEPTALTNANLINDLKSFSKIIARESITYKALLDSGFDTTKVKLCSDPAFSLPAVKCDISPKIAIGNTIGINLSPMAEAKESSKGITFENYCEMISYIITNTDMQIALIPHVIWNHNDDRKPLRKLFEKFKDTNRVVMVEDTSAEKLKYIISKCRFFIGARTHSTIAAYSSLVPTLVLGYSVKSIGIARDIFGTDENYVIPVQKLKKADDLLNAFKWLMDSEDNINGILKRIIPDYINKTRGNIEW